MSILDDLLNKIFGDSDQPKDMEVDSEQRNESFLDLIKAILKELGGK